MLKIGIFDDQEEHLNLIYQTLTEAFNKRNAHFEIQTFNDMQALQLILDGGISFDILFLDICMQEGTTLDFAQRLYLQHPDIRIVYITNYNNYYKDIFNSNVFYYVEKNDFPFKVNHIVSKILNDYAVKKIKIHTKNQDVYLNQSDIMYLERRLRKTYIEDCENNIYICNEKLSDIILRLNHQFIRVHESYIVNSHYIVVMKRTSLQLTHKKEIPISRKYHNLLKERIFL